MSKKIVSILLLLIFLIGTGCSYGGAKYNKPRNGGKRIVASGNMRR